MLKKLKTDIICCGIIILLIIIFLGKNIIVLDGKFMGGIDIPSYNYWNVGFIKEMLLSGSFPFWNPYFYSGHPFFANPSTFVLYPLVLLYVIFPLPWAFNLDILIHLLITAIGMYFLVKLITQSRQAGLASAICLSLNGYVIGRIALGHITYIHAIAFIPLIFYYAEKSLLTRQMRYLFITGLILGIQVLAGEPSNSYYTAFFLTLYFFARWISLQNSFRFQNIYPSFYRFIWIPITAFGICAVQILPTMEFRSLSDRASNTFEYATSWSFHPLYFFSFLVPYGSSPALPLVPEFGCYLGILSIILAVVGAVSSKYKKHTIILLIMLLISITLILGGYTPIYYLYYKLFPVLSTFRIPARALVIFTFIMSILVGFGLQYLYESGLKRWQYLHIMIGLILIFVCLFLEVICLKIPLNSKAMIYAIAFTITSFILFTLFCFIHNKQVMASMFIGVIFLDLYMVCSPLIPIADSKNLEQRNGFESIFNKDHDLYRVNIPGFSALHGLPNRGIKFHYYDINASSPFLLKKYFDFIYNMANVQHPAMFRHTFDADIFRLDTAFSSRILGVKYAIIETPTGFQMFTAKEYQPRATLIRNAIFTPQIENQLNILKNPSFKPTKIVLLQESDKNYILTGSISKGSPEQDKVSITLYSPNKIEFRSDSPSTTILLISELYYPGWKAFVDGKKVPILRADYLLRAVKLDAGQHSIRIVYQPMSFIIGAAITALTLLLLIAGFIRQYKRRSSAKLESFLTT